MKCGNLAHQIKLKRIFDLPNLLHAKKDLGLFLILCITKLKGKHAFWQKMLAVVVGYIKMNHTVLKTKPK